MSFEFPNEEDDDFGYLSNNSNLASIFHESDVQKSSSKSLVYTAPKQPSSKPLQANMSQTVVAAAAIMCYKLNNEKYEPLPGKIGIALLGEYESKAYQMILYQDKQRPLARARITSEFMIISQPNNFCTFNDDQRQNWAILFDSKEIAKKFLEEVNQMKKKVIQINSPLSGEVMSNDKIDGPVSSTVENRISDQEDSNKTRLMSRIAKLGQPILPLNGAIVAEDSDHEQITQSSPELEPQKQRSKTGKAPRPVPTPRIVAQSDQSDFSSGFTSMLVPSHQPSSVSVQQPYPLMQFLPPSFPGTMGSNSQHFDTLMSENRMHNSEVRMHLCRLSDKIDLLLQKASGSESYQKDRNRPAEEPHSNVLVTGLQKLQAQSDEHSNLLNLILGGVSASSNIRENSTNPLELLDQLLSSERHAWVASQKELDSTIQCLKEENNRLVHQIEEKSEREREIDARYHRLQGENARIKEDFQTIAFNQNEGTLNELRKENIRLAALLEVTSEKEKELESQHRGMEEKLDCYELKSTKIECLLLESERLIEVKERQISQLLEYVRNLEGEASDTRRIVEDLQFELKNAKTEIQDKCHHRHHGSVEEQVKMIMNKVYKEITKQFIPGESYSFHSIKSAVSGVIRDVTLAVLNGESTEKPITVWHNERENLKVRTTSTVDEVSVEATDSDIQEGNRTTILKENIDSIQEDNVDTLQPENESKERSVSFLESLHSSLAAASLQNEHGTAWKPEPPPPPIFDDFDNEDDWLN